jgi:hypothetical protein
MLIFLGLLFIAGSVAGFWAMLPKGGKVVWAGTAPVLESVIPITLMASFATGLALITTSF